jgi:hypothetical protein
MLFESAGPWLIAVALWLLLSQTPLRPRMTGALFVVALAVTLATVVAMVAMGASGVRFSGLAAVAAVITVYGSAAAHLRTRGFATLISAVSTVTIAIWSQTGWLLRLGADANLGHGVVDLSGLATAGLIGGSAALALNALAGRSASAMPLPTPRPAVLVIFDALLLLAGLTLSLLPHVALTTLGPHGLAIVLITAGLGLAYGWFATGRVHSTLLIRAMIAGAVTASSAPLLTFAAALILAVVAALCGLWLTHIIEKRTGLYDPAAVAGSIVLPAGLSLLMTGLAANGRLLAGWGGVGADSYLNQPGLGVVGWWVAGDIGQFSAQAVLLAIAFGVPAAMTVAVGAVISEFQPRWLLAGRRMSSRTTSTATELDLPIGSARPDTAPEPARVEAPRKVLPQARAYKVAYPFRKRGDMQKAPPPTFVVGTDAETPAP